MTRTRGRALARDASLRVLLALAGVLATACCASEIAPDASPLACAFPPVEEDADSVAECADRTPDGSFSVRPAALSHAAFRENGVGQVVIEGTLYFVTRAGRTAPALPFDNGADDFVEGLARTLRDGRVGFVNAELAEVVAPRWDFAFPFSEGVARVCLGCAITPVQGGEHRQVVGGKWGVIDTAGTVVVPVEFDRDSLPLARAGSGPASEP